MFKKNTQNLKKLIWQNSLLALVLLLSMNISSQDIGDEYLVNPGINSANGATSTTPDTGVDGSGNFPTLGGWGGGGSGAYATANTGNGDCHSADRMFKLFKKSGALGQFVYQDVTLPVGRFNWSFWTKWGALVNWDAEGDVTPKFTIETDDDGDGTWTVVQTKITTEPTTPQTWVQQLGTFDNPIERQVRIKFYKFGGTTAAQTNLNQIMFIDDVSLNYAGAITAAPADDTTLDDLTINGSTVAGFSSSESTYNVELALGTTVVPTVAATLYNTNGSSAITAATSLPGTTTIVITAEDGTTQRTVSINFTVMTIATDDTTLDDLTINGSTVAGFTSSQTTYAVELSYGTTVVPTVAATLYNTNGSSAITAATSLPGTTTIVITAEDGATQRTVSITFTVQALTAGLEFLVNPGINSATGANTTTPDTGVDGSGNMPANLGGWGAGGQGSYAPSSTANGNCLSEDRQFKFFKTSNSFVYQDVTIPAGNYNWSFNTRWLALVNWDAEGDVTPKFTIETDDDGDGSWTVVHTEITTQPTTINTWVEQTGTYTTDTERKVRIKFSKSGGSSAAPTNLNQIMAIDDVSFKYDSELSYGTDDTSLADLTINGSTVTGFTPSGTTYDVELPEGSAVPAVAATLNNTNGSNVITAATSIPGTTSIVITAEDGTTKRTVYINFSFPVVIEVGHEYLVNPGINTATGSTTATPDTGVDGSGNMPAHLGGWGSGANGSYAPSSTGNGNCHSADRMFKFFAKNDAYVTQTFTLPAGNYNWSFYTKWGGLVTWGAEGDVTPKFTIMTDDDGNGSWTTVQTTITTQPTEIETWVQQTGTYTNDTERQVRIKFSKSGGTDAAPTNLNQLMSIDDVSFKYGGTESWTGTSDANFNNASNWTSGVVPGVNDDVVIPSNGVVNITGDLTVKSMSIAAGASIISDGSITGSISYIRNIPTTNWYLISSPVASQDKDAFVAASNVATGTQASNLGFANYDNTTEAWSYYQSGTNGSGSFTQGQGHSIKLNAAGAVVFTGTFNDADATMAVSYNTNGYNLIGNPYLASVSVSELLGQANIVDLLSELTVYVWNQASGTYDLKNIAADMEIAPGQAFFVSAKTAGNFGITESMQSHSSDTFQRTTTKPEVVLSLSNGEASRTALISYIDGATTGFDNGYDSSIFGGIVNKFSVFTHAVANGSGRNLGLQALPKEDYQNMIVPLGVIAESGSTLEFSASSENLPEGIKVFLEDREENTFTRLDALNVVHKITTASAMNGVGRFYLHTTQSVLSITNPALDNVSVFKVNNSLRIVGLQQGKASVKLFNISGRQVLNAAFESNGTKDISLPRLAKGVYIVQLETAEGKLNKKIILE